MDKRGVITSIEPNGEFMENSKYVVAFENGDKGEIYKRIDKVEDLPFEIGSPVPYTIADAKSDAHLPKIKIHINNKREENLPEFGWDEPSILRQEAQSESPQPAKTIPKQQSTQFKQDPLKQASIEKQKALDLAIQFHIANGYDDPIEKHKETQDTADIWYTWISND